eukprot:s1_g223.t1
MPKIVDHEKRRQELIEASWQVIAAEGLEGVTMRKIAAEAGCTTGRLTHYFADREALILASLRASYDVTGDRTRVAIAEDIPPQEKLFRLVDEMLPSDDKRLLEWKVWIAFWSAATVDETLALENDARHDTWAEELADLIKEAAPDRDAKGEADLLIGLINGVGLHAAVNPTEPNLSRARRLLRAHIDALTT